MQQNRHDADYDPEATFLRNEVMDFINQIEEVIINFDNVPSIDRRAFAVYVLFRLR